MQHAKINGLTMNLVEFQQLHIVLLLMMGSFSYLAAGDKVVECSIYHGYEICWLSPKQKQK